LSQVTAGLVIGSLLAAWRLHEATEPQSLLVGRLVMGSGMTLVAITPWFPLIPPLMAVGGAGSGFLLAALYSQVQRHSPDSIRSSVFALFEAVGSAGFVIGVVSAGLMVQELGVRPAYLLAGLGTLLSAIPLYRNLHARSRGP
jgi:MFS family permease